MLQGAISLYRITLRTLPKTNIKYQEEKLYKRYREKVVVFIENDNIAIKFIPCNTDK